VTVRGPSRWAAHARCRLMEARVPYPHGGRPSGTARWPER
jgi:hypothetical protein